MVNFSLKSKLSHSLLKKKIQTKRSNLLMNAKKKGLLPRGDLVSTSVKGEPMGTWAASVVSTTSVARIGGKGIRGREMINYH